MRTGIVIDKWKLKIFKKVLKKAGYKFEVHPGLTAEDCLLTIELEDARKLLPVIKRAQNECRRSKLN